MRTDWKPMEHQHNHRCNPQMKRLIGWSKNWMIGVVAEVDAMALQMLADAWEDYQSARNVSKNNGPTYATTTAQGDLMWRPRPEVLMMNQSWSKVEKMMVQFGLTASSRAKIETQEKIETLDDLLE
jgi:P27 family predicted phage terminase small subunit